MMYSISQEAYILLATIYGGILIGFIYDLYRIFRGVFKPSKKATVIQDLLFWTMIFFVSFYVLIFSNQGALRFYNFLGFVIGAVGYQLLLSNLVLRALVFIIRKLQHFFKDLYQIAVYPFRLGKFMLAGPVTYCKNKGKPVYYKTKKLSRLPGRIKKGITKSVGTYFKKK
ncbi:Spore cortex biosynthesis protein YabQ [Alkaliphilus metalliredigens QYMF]|uniref:Spore cortex biosynthesis protein YabQ n=1 Tax=Alkaliphilus metalliredigens (strain QYMF) TaxID=293826 RepID=A6TJN9_ALKMQ|nr:spore cortex biosynthesis protein YabQ [Alkaliphilus metalliredigens]ABR46407.1 Spore cortex biosynthesis protein YabQ [Alkaliphilus metalliredigens QYMF]